MDISLSNKEIIAPDFSNAIGLLLSKQLPESINYQVVDLKEYIEKRIKRYNERLRQLMKIHGAQEVEKAHDTVLQFSVDNPAPKAFHDAVSELQSVVGKIQMDKIALPSKDSSDKEIRYEALIYASLKKILPDRQSTVKDLDEETTPV